MNKPKETTAFVSEIFSSVQGEGVNIGRRQLFARFCDCHRDCVYCDTPVMRTDTAAVEREPGSGVFEQVPNPLSPSSLVDILQSFNQAALAHDDIFITGGEPLLHVDFLALALPPLVKRVRLPIHLETSGDLPEAYRRIAHHIDHTLMDIKLPSVTGERETWNLHKRFMAAIQSAVTIKLVVSADTTAEDLATAAGLIAASKPNAHVVLQPMTAALRTDRVPSPRQILTWQSEMALAIGAPVRVIPQCHKLMGLL
ncbi:MAG: 7-carboxy-7-deazaguanine synthase QueE [Lentisphaeria bacterium]|nr:7-carboxy-7-deazaguanine synthase QueE [Lentisphaeria bacterium]